MKAYLTAHVKAVEFIEQNPEESQGLVIKHIKELQGKKLIKKNSKLHLARMEVTTSVNEEVIQEMADISKEAGYVPDSNIEGLIQLEHLKSLEETK